MEFGLLFQQLSFALRRKNCGCAAAEPCLTSRWSDRQGAKPEDGGTSHKHGFGDAEQEQARL